MSNLKTLIAVSTMMGAFSDPFLNAMDTMPKFNATRGRRIDVRTEPKIGRNEPCPCGSGIKYKRCGAVGKCSHEE